MNCNLVAMTEYTLSCKKKKHKRLHNFLYYKITYMESWKVQTPTPHSPGQPHLSSFPPHFWETGFLCVAGCPHTHSIDQAGPKLNRSVCSCVLCARLLRHHSQLSLTFKVGLTFCFLSLFQKGV